MLISAILAAVLTANDAEPLTIERIFADPPLTGTSVRAVQFAPDSSAVTWLQSRADSASTAELWLFDIGTDEARKIAGAPPARELTAAEEGVLERQRLAGQQGITSYVWNATGSQIAIPGGERLRLFDRQNGTLEDLPVRGAVLDPKFSPDNRFLSYVEDDALMLLELQSGEQMTVRAPDDDQPNIRFAVAEFVAQEEMDRDTGYWWAPDAKAIVYTAVDESPIPVSRRFEMEPGGLQVIEQRYPYTGGPNAKVALIHHELGGDATQLDWQRHFTTGEDTAEWYLARVGFAPDGSKLFIQRHSRDQKRLELIAWEAATESWERLHVETHPDWVHLHNDFRALPDGRLIWRSERDGHSRLYLLGDEPKALTPQLGHVDAIKAVVPQSGQVFVSGWDDDPLEKHLFRLDVDTGETSTLTEAGGWHETAVAPDGTRFVDAFSTPIEPETVSLRQTSDGVIQRTLLANRIAQDHPLAPYRGQLQMPEFGSLDSADDQPLYYRLIKPAGAKEGKRYPVVVYVYGGPGVQRVTRAFQGKRALFEQFLAQQGFGVFALDNRGSARRGRAFTHSLYRSMGSAEVADQATGVRFLSTKAWVDSDRIGIYGGSYGGYMTIMALAQQPALYAAGVAIAPVTDWKLYDTHYTERYLGTPQEHADAYESSSVFAHLDGLSDPLLIVHGMADDNVLFTHSTRLFSELQERGQSFEMMTYPGAKHSIAGEKNQIHLHRTLFAFFARTLDLGR